MNNASLINQTSGKEEYFTPPQIIRAARMVMGKIDLDPASCAQANEIVKANEYHTREQDGIVQDWFGRVWMNHPFGRENNPVWIQRVVQAYQAEEIEEACVLTYACTSEKWYQPLLSKPVCFLHPRLNYLVWDGEKLVEATGVTKGSSVTYFGRDISQFIVYFGKLGQVKL